MIEPKFIKSGNFSSKINTILKYNDSFSEIIQSENLSIKTKIKELYVEQGFLKGNNESF